MSCYCICCDAKQIDFNLQDSLQPCLKDSTKTLPAKLSIVENVPWLSFQSRLSSDQGRVYLFLDFFLALYVWPDANYILEDRYFFFNNTLQESSRHSVWITVDVNCCRSLIALFTHYFSELMQLRTVIRKCVYCDGKIQGFLIIFVWGRVASRAQMGAVFP